MPAHVHGGSLGRWFEELCRIRCRRLADAVAENGTRVLRGRLPAHGGVYAFWWIGSVRLLQSRRCNRRLTLVGPGKRPVALEIDNEWLGLRTKLPIPLYVGKSAAHIGKRVGLHLMLSKKRILRPGRGSSKAKPPTTSCQLRAGIEHLFPDDQDTRTILLENVGLSFVDLHGDLNAANRFYLEDLAIGLMRPPLNVDVER